MNAILTPTTETIAALVVLIGIVAWAVSNRLVTVLARIDRRNAEQDAQTAADHDEPTRAEVEADAFWFLFDAPEFVTETPLYAETAAYLLRTELDDEVAVGRWLA